jgi:hypothetical protein
MVFQKVVYVHVISHMSSVLFAKRTSDGPPTYARTRDMGVRPPNLAYVHLQRVNISFYFLTDQGVVRLTLRVLGLVKTILLKTFVVHFYGKDKKVFSFSFYHLLIEISSSKFKSFQNQR